MSFQEVEEVEKQKVRLAAKAEREAAAQAAREDRARKLKLMSKGAAMVED